MSQNSIIAAALTIGFIVFITVRGELPKYFGALGLGPTPEQPSSTGVGIGTSTSAAATGATLLVS